MFQVKYDLANFVSDILLVSNALFVVLSADFVVVVPAFTNFAKFPRIIAIPVVGHIFWNKSDSCVHF